MAIKGFIIIRKWSGLLCLCAIFYISTYFLWTGDFTYQRWLPFCKNCPACHMTLSPRDSPKVCVVPGRRRQRTSCSWAIKVGHALLLHLDSSTLHTLVAAKLMSCLWDVPILCRARTDACFFLRQVSHCAHGQDDEIKTLLSLWLEVFIGRRQTFQELWLRSGY